MTTRWRPDFDPHHLYFVTTTTANRAPIFRREIIKRIVVDALYYVSLMNKTSLYAFVIMPNHVHILLQCVESAPLRTWARAFKSAAARLIVRHYQVEGNKAVLETLGATVKRAEKQQYKVWEDGYLAKDIFTPGVLAQKLDYIHNNPLQPHWRLVDGAADYVWSSAGYYLENRPALIPICDVRALLV